MDIWGMDNMNEELRRFLESGGAGDEGNEQPVGGIMLVQFPNGLQVPMSVPPSLVENMALLQQVVSQTRRELRFISEAWDDCRHDEQITAILAASPLTKRVLLVALAKMMKAFTSIAHDMFPIFGAFAPGLAGNDGEGFREGLANFLVPYMEAVKPIFDALTAEVEGIAASGGVSGDSPSRRIIATGSVAPADESVPLTDEEAATAMRLLSQLFGGQSAL